MADHDRRVSSAQLALGAETIRRRLRGEKFRLFPRVTANIGVYTSGNEMRMGKGKGTWDYWACRVPVNKIIFELKGEMHEKIARDALRLAAAKMPGEYKSPALGEDEANF
jgi:ribosomal protein L16